MSSPPTRSFPLALVLALTLIFALSLLSPLGGASARAEGPSSPAATSPPQPAQPAQPGGALSRQARFAAANRLYLRGEYSAAARAYAELHASERIEDPILYHNLGNAYFRVGAYGSAILYYRRALRMDPPAEVADALRRNLDAARRTLRARYRSSDKGQVVYAEAGGLLYRATHVLDRTPTALLFAALFVLLMGLLIARRLRPGRARGLGRVAVPVALATTLVGLALWGQVYTDASQRVGVIVTDDARLRDGKDMQSKGRIIHEGQEVRILREDGPWTMVGKTDGQRGWVKSGDVKQI